MPSITTKPVPEARPAAASPIYPCTFSPQDPAAAPYLRDPATRILLEFFHAKGLAALKDEDQRQQSYADWLAFQAHHRLYATVLSPSQYSTPGHSFDLLRYVRFIEVFACCSPAHGYSLQVTFLGLFAILMGSNEALKREAVARLEVGELLAFGISEKNHGSDLLASEFHITPAAAPGQWLANGSKYYIGNANVASLIAVLGKKEGDDDSHSDARRMPFMLLALRPPRGTPHWQEHKIPTLGVRAAHVGAFAVQDYPLPQTDIIAQGRQAWDAVFGTVTLGKFFLGFGSIGICERALAEAAAHVQQRILYGKPVLAMPHIRALMAQAYARLLAMKLYAYRALDYLRAATVGDRRYQLFCAVQKAKVSTEGVKVMALLSECLGAKAFQADTYCEMALRDAALIPGLEGSMHINLGLAAGFLPRYFHPRKEGQGRGSRGARAAPLPDPPSLLAEPAQAPAENPYLMVARTGGTSTIQFPWLLDAYRGLATIPNVARFIRQAAAFRRLARQHQPIDPADTQTTLALGQCLTVLVYAQLIAENAQRLTIPSQFISIIFSLLIADLNTAALQLAAIPSTDAPRRVALLRMVKVPQTTAAEWDAVAERVESLVRRES